jgi:hypothetical protein
MLHILKDKQRNMKIFMVSTNALFSEALCGMFLKRVDIEILQINPDAARAEIAACFPEIILVDESVTSSEELAGSVRRHALYVNSARYC